MNGFGCRTAVVWVTASGLLLSGCWNTSYGVPAWQVAAFAAILAKDSVVCAVTGCPAELPEGMVEETFAAGEILPDVPVAIDADEWGRLYVAEGGRILAGVEDNRAHSAGWYADDLASRSVEDRRAYIEKWLAAGEFEDPHHFTRLADRLIRLEDRDGDGRADHVDELARFDDVTDGPIAGVLAHEGSVFVTEIPGVYRFDDLDGDGTPETRATLSTGYGVKTSLMGHDLHGLTWGPDGRLYFSMGDRGYAVTSREGRHFEPTLGPGRGAVFRMHPDGSGLEVFATGVRNPQELAFDDFGNLFTGDNNGDGGDRARLVYLVDGGETGWAMPYQTLIGDYVRGPWNAERLWELQHPGQPAWVLPPVAYVATGPAGFAAYPGLGLPERYANHFFLADYRYQRAVSGVISFAVEPEGASFRMVDEHRFAGSILSTDVDFGYDGTIFVSAFDQIGADQRILALRHPESASDPRVAEVVGLVQAGMGERPADELVGLLAHADRRIRQRAQFELARRGDPAPLRDLVLDEGAALLPRLHALWALGQIGAGALATLGADLAWTGSAPELLPQALELAGEAGADFLVPGLLAALDHPSERVRFFAAQSLGRLAVSEAVDPLLELLRENADRDVYVRHAASLALHRIDDVDALHARLGDPSRAVRLGVLLALRHRADPALAAFLSDEDPFLVLEASRAIHDLPIADALPQLAALPFERLPTDADPQSSLALHRRVISANLGLGTEEAALRLAAHAAHDAFPRSMRELALEALGGFSAPAPRDLVMGFHRPLAPRPQRIVHAALDRYGPALIDGPFGARALEIAQRHGRVPLDDEALLARVRNADLDDASRIAALSVLAERSPGGATAHAARRAALESSSPRLRAAGRASLAAAEPDAALASIRRLPHDASVAERQAALATVAGIRGTAAARHLLEQLGELRAGSWEPALELDLLEAAGQRPEPEVARALEEQHRNEERRSAGDLVALRRWALHGGDAERGRLVFQGAGDCQRCHSRGHGAAGPSLDGIGSRRTSEQLLRSVLDPQAEIAPGFAQVAVTLRGGRIVSGLLAGEEDGTLGIIDASGRTVRVPLDEIATRSRPVSGMPPMGLGLAPRQLRDLLAYLQTL